jgi:casein kinase 1
MASNSQRDVVGVHYRVGKKIDEGSFSVVYEGIHISKNIRVAIKFVRATSP